MSIQQRLDWSRKMAELTASLDRLRADPDQVQFKAACAEMHAFTLRRSSPEQSVYRRAGIAASNLRPDDSTVRRGSPPYDRNPQPSQGGAKDQA